MLAHFTEGWRVIARYLPYFFRGRRANTLFGIALGSAALGGLVGAMLGIFASNRPTTAVDDGVFTAILAFTLGWSSCVLVWRRAEQIGQVPRGSLDDGLYSSIVAASREGTLVAIDLEDRRRAAVYADYQLRAGAPGFLFSLSLFGLVAAYLFSAKLGTLPSAASIAGTVFVLFRLVYSAAQLIALGMASTVARAAPDAVSPAWVVPAD